MKPPNSRRLLARRSLVISTSAVGALAVTDSMNCDPLQLMRFNADKRHYVKL